jgi:hypothetical protein
MFYFYSPLQTVFTSPTVSDTTQAGTNSTTRTTIKSYNLTLPSGANRIRVIVWGWTGGAGGGPGGTFILNIDGVDVATRTLISESETIIIDYNGSITPGSHIVRVDGYCVDPGAGIRVTRVYIATGVGVTSTTLTDLITFNVAYQLLRSGDIRYSPGVRVFVYGNRKTTATTTLQVGSSPITGRNQLGAGNDNATAEVFLAIITGGVTLQEGGEFTIDVSIRGGVGASGDTMIVTRIMARAQLRRETLYVGEVRVYERGVAEYFAQAGLVSVPGGNPNTAHQLQFRNLFDTFIYWITISGSGTSVYLYNFKVAVVTPIHFSADFSADGQGEAYLEWVQLVVWG